MQNPIDAAAILSAASKTMDKIERAPNEKAIGKVIKATLAENDLVFGIWEDKAKPGGIGTMILKGSDLLERVAAGTESVQAKWSAISFPTEADANDFILYYPSKQLDPPPTSIHFDGEEMFVVSGGKRIAKRGQPGTPQAGTWVSLEPGYTVFSSADHREITVEYKGQKLQ